MFKCDLLNEEGLCVVDNKPCDKCKEEE